MSCLSFNIMFCFYQEWVPSSVYDVPCESLLGKDMLSQPSHDMTMTTTTTTTSSKSQQPLFRGELCPVRGDDARQLQSTSTKTKGLPLNR